MIKLINVYKSFGKKHVLRGVNLTIEPNKTTVILGPSGSGKSTIIKHMVALLKPDKGEVWVEGINLAEATEEQIFAVRKRVGFLFQSGALFDSMNIYDNTAFPLREHTKLSEKEIEVEVRKRLEMVGLKFEEVAHLYPDELSGGMQKRAGLARTIILNPEIILYDEPTSGLDPITSDLISRMILKLQHEMGTTSVVISHDIKESFKIADKMAMLYEGKIIAYGDPEFFKTTDNPIIRRFIDGISDIEID
ncbi:MAG: ABC transporter ATP-binding protein [Epsilonproteobacteria bacterium]|nr:ABC transporter ATP-binding protein [Campylobacterota bacterium]